VGAGGFFILCYVVNEEENKEDKELEERSISMHMTLITRQIQI
jgi:hypothetical protein